MKNSSDVSKKRMESCTVEKPRLVVVYYGRFQPPHKGHFEVYSALQRKFGAKNVYIGTSNKVDYETSPLTFTWKEKIFRSNGIQSKQLIQTKRNYRADEIVDYLRLDPDNTVFVAAIGEKDAARLASGKYYKPYVKGMKFAPMSEHGYYYTIPNVTYKGKIVSATDIRKVLRQDDLDKQDYDYLNGMMGASRAMVDNLKKLFEHEEEFGDLLTEGGQAGHVSHPYEDTSLTFKEMEDIIRASLDGSLSRQEVTEKVDGINLFGSIINGKLRLARNKGQIKNRGEGSLTISDVSKKWSDNPAVKIAFVDGANELQAQLLKLPKDVLEGVFKNGENWINFEVVWSSSVNVIDYDENLIVLHSVTIVDEKGNNAGVDSSAQKKLFGAIKQLDTPSSVKTPVMMTIGKSEKFDAKLSDLLGRLNKFKSKNGMGSKNTVGQWLEVYWDKQLAKLEKKFGEKIPSEIRGKIIGRLAYQDKSYRLKVRDIPSAPLFTSVKALDVDADKTNKKETEPLEILFLRLGAEVLRNVEKFLAANPDKTLDKLRSDINAQISAISRSSNIEDLEKMRTQLRRIDAIGGLKAVVPTEGIVFKWNGKSYKLTGLYAPINQLMGIGRFGR